VKSRYKKNVNTPLKLLYREKKSKNFQIFSWELELINHLILKEIKLKSRKLEFDSELVDLANLSQKLQPSVNF
jgi:hypothetical protein